MKVKILALWVISIALAMYTSNLSMLLIPYALFAVNETTYITTGADALPSKERTSLFYDISTFASGASNNYSEGYYPDGDYSISPKQAEINKFEKFLSLLEVKPGDTVLDMGCGMLTFMEYCRDHKGINVVGLTLSPLQTARGKEKGLEVHAWDFTVFNPDLQHRFDAAILVGSTEHVYGGRPGDLATYDLKRDKMRDLLAMVRSYFKPRAHKPRMMFSGLHIDPMYIHEFPYYCMTRLYGGTYQLDTPTHDVRASARAAGYETLYWKDATEYYYMATVTDPDHFGRSCYFLSSSMSKLLLLGFVYPIAWYIWLYYVFGMWMWMFDGRLHMASDPKYSLNPRGHGTRPCTLWWAMFEVIPGTRVDD
jgi:cyclopropane fatty-acyl-phospholipid synthase-like methyltransferase